MAHRKIIGKKEVEKKRQKCKPNNKNGLTNARNMRMIGKESIRTIPFCDMRTGMQNLRTIEFKIRRQK